MKPTRLNFSTPPNLDASSSYFPHEPRLIGTKIRRAAKRFMAFRAAKLAADPSVDTFFNRGESAARFAYFD